ncbi:MAG: AraC family transcriptional regulator [Woeseiaceae bacterium]|nr:AraC family transcriptional regulator [Woeseiaceae bacterium]
MRFEPTTIASVARLVGETLQIDYDVDPETIFADLQIDTDKFHKPGERIAFSKMTELWKRGADVTGDPEFGLRVGRRLVPGDFFVLGHAWLASDSLHDAFQRLCRYFNVLTTLGHHMDVRDLGDRYALVEDGANRLVNPEQVAKDAFFAALLRMCDFVTATPVRPLGVALPQAADASSIDYTAVFSCPVSFGATPESWEFDKKTLDAPLTGAIPEVADAIDRIADNYTASLDEGAIAHEVRQMIVQLLPSGKVDQESIASKLNRSRSTLQRQLHGEGTSYRDILESTRQVLSERYLRDGDYSQAEVAFMVGFSDQSNFARAFKRWTGMSPGEFQKAA